MIYKSMEFLDDDVIEYRKKKRNVYRSEEGQKELLNLLFDCGLFSLITPEQVSLRNLAIKKLEELGLLDEARIRHVVNYLLNSGNIEILEHNEYEDYRKAKNRNEIPDMEI